MGKSEQQLALKELCTDGKKPDILSQGMRSPNFTVWDGKAVPGPSKQQNSATLNRKLRRILRKGGNEKLLGAIIECCALQGWQGPCINEKAYIIK